MTIPGMCNSLGQNYFCQQNFSIYINIYMYIYVYLCMYLYMYLELKDYNESKFICSEIEQKTALKVVYSINQICIVKNESIGFWTCYEYNYYFYRYNCYIKVFTIGEFKTIHLHFQLSLSMITIRINFEAYSPNNFIKD